MAVHKSKNPAYPDAHPTAPGGMSMAALVKELVERHGYDEDPLADIKWPDLIQMVIVARQDEERRVKEPVERHGYDVLEPLLEDIAAEEEEEEEEDMFDDLDDLFEDEPVNGYYHHDPTVDSAPQPVPETEETVLDPEAMFEEMMAERDSEQAKNPPLFLGIPGTRDYIFDGHAGAGPSASERWMTCTMSLTASRDFLKSLTPNQQAKFAGANTAARQGTTAHSVGEAQANLMLGRMEQDEFDATILSLTLEPDEEAEAYTDEMAEYVTEYTDLIMSYAAERGADHILIEEAVEAAIPLTDLHEDEVYVVRGKGDCVVMPTPEDPDLVVIDLKYGEGIWVDVEENTQEMMYALGALGLLTDDEGNLITDVETITLYIAQPRMGGLRKWTLTLDELFDWRDEVLAPALTAALYGEGAEFAPSKTACQFCPARGRCPALAEQRMADAAEAFDVIIESEMEGEEFPETTSLSDERLGSLLNQIGGLVGIHSDLRAEAERRLFRGGKVPGYTLVNYTPQRKWKDGALDKIPSRMKARGLIKDPALVTPTQAEKILKDDYAKISALVDKPPIRPVIAPEGDRRKLWGGPPPEQMFDDEGDE